MSNIDAATAAAARAYAKQQYEKDMVRGQGQGAPILERIGPPYWDRQAWEAFKETYGRYPHPHEGDLPNIQGMPEWAWRLLGLRPPPVDVSTGNQGATPVQQDLTLWRIK